MVNERARGVGNAVMGVLLVALGLLFLAAQFVNFRLWFGFDFGHYFWPFFVIIPGLCFYVGMLLGGRSAGALAIPGTILTTIGLILLYQNVSNHFESWAYAWALIPTAVGVGMMISGAWSGVERQVRVGRGMVTVGLLLFAAGLVFFEFVLNISGFSRGLVGAVAGPALLIMVGLYLLFRPRK